MKMTRAVYHHFVKGYFEKDKYLFSFVLSGEVCCFQCPYTESV